MKIRPEKTGRNVHSFYFLGQSLRDSASVAIEKRGLSPTFTSFHSILSALQAGDWPPRTEPFIPWVRDDTEMSSMWEKNFLLGGIVLSGSALYFPIFFLLIWPFYVSVAGVFIKFLFEALGVWLLYLAFRWLVSFKVSLSPRAVIGTARVISSLGHAAIVVGHLIALYGLFQIVVPEKLAIEPGMYTVSNEAPVPLFAFGYCYLLGLIAVFVAGPSKENANRAIS